MYLQQGGGYRATIGLLSFVFQIGLFNQGKQSQSSFVNVGVEKTHCVGDKQPFYINVTNTGVFYSK